LDVKGNTPILVARATLGVCLDYHCALPTGDQRRYDGAYDGSVTFFPEKIFAQKRRAAWLCSPCHL
jgi:hypothetical protein